MSDLYKNVDGVRIKLTEDEVKQREKDEQDFIDDIPERLKRRLRNKREDLLLDKDHIQRIWVLRNYLADMNSVEAIEFMKDRLQKTKDNNEFLITMNG